MITTQQTTNTNTAGWTRDPRHPTTEGMYALRQTINGPVLGYAREVDPNGLEVTVAGNPAAIDTVYTLEAAREFIANNR